MSIVTHFKSDRTGAGSAFKSDRSGSAHARFMRLSSYALAPLGILAAWYLANVAGKPLDELCAVIARPLPALTLLLFAVLGMIHARQGMTEIIEDYVHDAALKELALKANKWTSIAIAAIWVFAILVIAAPK